MIIKALLYLTITMVVFSAPSGDKMKQVPVIFKRIRDIQPIIIPVSILDIWISNLQKKELIMSSWNL